MAIISGIRRTIASIASGLFLTSMAFAQINLPSPLKFESQPDARFQFDGFVGQRVQAMVDNWLLQVPGANPGLLEMFAVRDREPKPNLVPWAGEFVGKYLISAIQAQRLTTNQQLDRLVRDIVTGLMAGQAEDGYLGPFPKAERLRGHWDLWGHYHCMLALLMWNAATGDEAALKSARRAADLMCKTYLNSGRRPFEAGSDEMNLAVIHSLGWLYRVTGEPRYLQLMRVIEKDWERGGDYFRKGLEGVEFFQSPRPRWESLHDLQGLVELYRISGDQRYRDSFEHHWRSIARWDLRNTGGFSSGEQATGNPYAPTPIETCCSIAWMCLSVDMLALTADPKVADKLEVATLNAWAGAQHTSGRWCTYNTPMDGAREASAHTIVFQSRAGTPELNCCSVNGPRGWGMLSEWSTMIAPDGIVQNWLGPSSTTVTLGHLRVRLRIEGNYPRESPIVLLVEPEQPQEFTLRMRVPEWSSHAVASLNNKTLPA
ncbi:MAG TPA: beta-L-arabinofuranosidase domain-containing protein, partial [Candidatus Saccharimonadales bacterium]|nr:beta-L-arabinofuranosidase domain-containing protein [Candidatus Saccharimonadales bacterium]